MKLWYPFIFLFFFCSWDWHKNDLHCILKVPICQNSWQIFPNTPPILGDLCYIMSWYILPFLLCSFGSKINSASYISCLLSLREYISDLTDISLWDSKYRRSLGARVRFKLVFLFCNILCLFPFLYTGHQKIDNKPFFLHQNKRH